MPSVSFEAHASGSLKRTVDHLGKSDASEVEQIPFAKRSTAAKLVFDIGANFGQSTERYLASGFRVLAVEPNPVAMEAIRKRLRQHVITGQLVLEEKAVCAQQANTQIPLYINEEDSEWSSIYAACGQRFDTEATVVKVASTTLGDLYESYGLPHYLKSDTEGSDGIVLKQLRDLKMEPPAYLSFELNSLVYLQEATALGYDCFKIVGQSINTAEELQDRHGRPLTHAGKFGEEVVGICGDGAWRSYEETLSDCYKLCWIHDAKVDTEEFASGPPHYVDRDFATLRACFPVESRDDEEWYDIHCRHKSVRNLQGQPQVGAAKSS